MYYGPGHPIFWNHSFKQMPSTYREVVSRFMLTLVLGLRQQDP